MDITELSTTRSAQRLERIGFGNCGTVWAHPFPDIDTQPSALVLKREDGSPGRSLIKEYLMHNQILAALHASEKVPAMYRVNIPASILFMDETSPHWASILPGLPSDHTACNALVSERIMPVPQNVRQLLAHRFWDGDVDDMANDKNNEHCLIQLGLPADEYAISMADTLAFLHWSAKVDASDVEFVLARRRTQPQPETGSESRSGIGSREFTPGAIGPHAMWLLDFDCCNQLTMDEAGVEQAAKCFWRNDPFYPRPGSGSPEREELWEVFKARFLKSSEEILHAEDMALRQLPGMLMERIVETRGVWARNRAI